MAGSHEAKLAETNWKLPVGLGFSLRGRSDSFLFPEEPQEASMLSVSLQLQPATRGTVAANKWAKCCLVSSKQHLVSELVRSFVRILFQH